MRLLTTFCVLAVALCLFGGHVAKNSMERDILSGLRASHENGVRMDAVKAAVDPFSMEIILHGFVAERDRLKAVAKRVVIPAHAEALLGMALDSLRGRGVAFVLDDFSAEGLAFSMDNEEFLRAESVSAEGLKLPNVAIADGESLYRWLGDFAFDKIAVKGISGILTIAVAEADWKRGAKIGRLSAEGFSVGSQKDGVLISVSRMSALNCSMPSFAAVGELLDDSDKAVERWFGDGGIASFARRLRDMSPVPFTEIRADGGSVFLLVNGKHEVRVAWDEASATCEEKDGGVRCWQSVSNLSTNTEWAKELGLKLRHVPGRLFASFESSESATNAGASLKSKTSVNGFFTSEYEASVNPEMRLSSLQGYFLNSGVVPVVVANLGPTDEQGLDAFKLLLEGAGQLAAGVFDEDALAAFKEFLLNPGTLYFELKPNMAEKFDEALRGKDVGALKLWQFSTGNGKPIEEQIKELQ